MAWQSVGQLGSASGTSPLTPSSRTSAWAGAAATRAPTQAKAVAKRRIDKIEHGPSTHVALADSTPLKDPLFVLGDRVRVWMLSSSTRAPDWSWPAWRWTTPTWP